MAIPGLKAVHDVKAKVRIGEKREATKNGKTFTFPASTDHFVCDDAEFLAVVGDKAKHIRIFLPFKDAADNFGTGLEWWQGKLLACYSKGDVQEVIDPGGRRRDGVPTAFRQATMKKGGKDVNLLEGANVLSPEPVGKDRRRIECPVRECPILKRKDCKPMGRLQFWIEGIDRTSGVYQVDTKSWNSIERIEATLGYYPDLRGIPFNLTVEIVQKGRDKFPVLSLEAAVEVNSPQDAALADALIQLDKAVQLDARPDQDDQATRRALAAVLDLTNPGWRDKPEFAERIKAVGVEAAALKMLEKLV